MSVCIDVTVFACDHCGTHKKVCMLTAGLMSMWLCATCLRRIAFFTDASHPSDPASPPQAARVVPS